MWFQSLCREDLLEEEMTTHSSILAWRIPWTEEPGGLQSMGSQRARHDWSDLAHIFHIGGFFKMLATLDSPVIYKKLIESHVGMNIFTIFGASLLGYQAENWILFVLLTITSFSTHWATEDFPHSSVSKEPACSAGDSGSIPGLGRSPGERNGNPL